MCVRHILQATIHLNWHLKPSRWYTVFWQRCSSHKKYDDDDQAFSSINNTFLLFAKSKVLPTRGMNPYLVIYLVIMNIVLDYITMQLFADYWKLKSLLSASCQQQQFSLENWWRIQNSIQNSQEHECVWRLSGCGMCQHVGKKGTEFGCPGAPAFLQINGL